MKPIIGITLDFQTKAELEGGYSNYPWYALRTHYARAVEDAGGTPIHIPYAKDNISNYVDLCDGFIFPGGDYDINPAFYGEKIEPETLLSTDDRVLFEAKLLRSAMEKEIPILGICAGHQLLNIVCGGTLYQHIPNDIPAAIIHKHDRDYAEPCHDILVDRESLLYKIVETDSYKVNSHHHQAIRGFGANLRISATAKDGVVEAIEHSELPFCLGIEWHPEYLQNIYDRRIFDSLIAASSFFKNAKK
jgi:putative glutamine amidotransferase